MNIRKQKKPYQDSHGRTCLPGYGPLPARMLVVTSCPSKEDLEDGIVGKYGGKIKDPPALDKGPSGQVIMDCALRAGLLPEDIRRTCLVRHAPAKNKPSAAEIKEAAGEFEAEVLACKPEIVVCLGKEPFDLMVGRKLKERDVDGGIFWSDRFGCKVMLSVNPTRLHSSPELILRITKDFAEAKREMLGRPDSVERQYRVISNIDQLRGFTGEMLAGGFKLAAVDCEWHGPNFIDGQLRSLQIAWAPGQAVFIRFMDDRMNYVFDVSYAEAGMALLPWMASPDVKYLGHHIAADLPWMSRWLKLPWRGKTYIDTEFAQQTLDEYSELQLERLSLRYTDLGRYDIDLMLWCKDHPDLAKGGYGRVPEPLLVEYACRDVDATFRIAKALEPLLKADGVWEYYQNIRNPFVTDVFTYFHMTGLPFDTEGLAAVRRIYLWGSEKLQEEFLNAIDAEARLLLASALTRSGAPPQEAARPLMEDIRDPMKWVASLSLSNPAPNLQACLEHYAIRKEFNHKTYAHMARWLFDVKGHMPIKSTPNRAKGMPSMSWDKVMDLPEREREKYTPSTDQQVLTILAQQDPLVDKLLLLKAVVNQTNSFTGKEEDGSDGLQKWVASDGRVHGMLSTTETGRPRAWNPNVLNWPKYINAKIARAIGSLSLDDAPDEMLALEGKSIPSVRSMVRADLVEPGGRPWCFVESDYQTAEVRGLAYISGDERLIDIIEKPDEDFGLVEDDGALFPVRLRVPESLFGSKEAENCVMCLWRKGRMIRPVSEHELVMREGKKVHPKADLHWSLAEMAFKRPREMMDPDADRGAGKVANFSSAYGASPASLERKIEADTGKRPEKGTGQALLDALAERQPDAVAFLEKMANLPFQGKEYVAASGAKRRPSGHPDNFGFSKRSMESFLSGVGREMRNFPLQESVAATAARAGCWLLEFKVKNELEGGPVVILYDSVLTLCPPEERTVWALAHELFMHRANAWKYGNRVLRYPIDTEFCFRWSTKPSNEEKELLRCPDWHPPTLRLDKLAKWVEEEIAKRDTPERGLEPVRTSPV